MHLSKATFWAVTFCTSMVLNACIELPNLNPTNPDNQMCVLDVGEVYEPGFEQTTYSFEFQNPETDGNFVFYFQGTLDADGRVYHHVSLFRDPGLGVLIPQRVGVNTLSPLGGLRNDVVLLQPGQLNGGEIPFTQWRNSGNFAWDACPGAIICTGVIATEQYPDDFFPNGAYIPFYFDDIDGRHFGWIRIVQTIEFGSLVTLQNSKTVIEEIAFSKLANRAVRMGQR